jgi:hypothetical protein
MPSQGRISRFGPKAETDSRVQSPWGDESRLPTISVQLRTQVADVLVHNIGLCLVSVPQSVFKDLLAREHPAGVMIDPLGWDPTCVLVQHADANSPVMTNCV